MTLVFREQRKTLFDRPTEPSSLGPGAYFRQPQQTKRSDKLAASDVGFLRRGDHDSCLGTAYNFPGPGHYTENSCSKIFQKYDSKSACFRSKVSRFQVMLVETPPTIPPKQSEIRLGLFENGTVDLSEDNLFHKHLRKRLHPEKNGFQLKTRQLPSIPSKKQTYGYRTDEKGELAANQSPAELTNNYKDRSVGPGSYNLTPIPSGMLTDGCGWSHSKSRRQVFKAKPLLNKHTCLPGEEDSPGVKGAYVSRLEKETGGRSLIKHELLKQHMRRKFGKYYQQSQQKLQLLLKAVSEKENIGPGTYCQQRDTKQQSRAKDEGQCFMSKQPRFKSEPTVLLQIQQTGKTPPNARVQWKGPPINHALTDKRFRSKRQECPGPGSYQQSTLDYNNSTYSFSRQARFAGCDISSNPGPADYSVTIPPNSKSVVKYDCNQHIPTQKQPPARLATEDREMEDVLCSRIPFGSNVDRECIYGVEKEPSREKLPPKHYRRGLQPHGHLYKSVRKSHYSSSDTEPSAGSPGPGTYERPCTLLRSTFNITAGRTGHDVT